MEKHKLIEMIKNEAEDNIPICVIYNDDSLSDEIFISQTKDEKGNKITIIGDCDYSNSILYRGGF